MYPPGPHTSADLDRFMFEKIMSLNDVVEGYDLFNNRKVQKVIFKPML